MGGGKVGGGFQNTAGSKFNYSVQYRKSCKISRKKQDKHIKGTDKYDKAVRKGENPSFVTADAKEMLKQGAGKGHMCAKNCEVFDYKKNIGYYVNEFTGAKYKTTRATIHYDTYGNAHVVPARPRWMLPK